MPVLKRRAEFVRLNRSGFRFHQPAFVVLLLAQERRGDSPETLPVRIGFTATRKLGNAVQRNRAKRRLRALWRTEVIKDDTREQQLRGFDCVLIAKAEIFTQEFSQLQESLHYSLDKSLRLLHQGAARSRRRRVKKQGDR